MADSKNLDQPDYLSPGIIEWRRRTDGPLLIIAIGSLPFLLLELVRNDLTVGDRRFLDVVNITVLILFAVDYLVELRLASDRRRFVRNEWTSLLIVLAQAVAVIPALAGFGALRAVRGGRAVRALAAIVRIVAIGGVSAREGRAVLRRKAATFALSLAGLTWITAAVCFALAEDVGQDGRVSSFLDALWWSSMTITTIGYGDIYPITTAGRIVATVTAVVGISAFAIVTAKVAEFLTRPDIEAVTQAGLSQPDPASSDSPSA